jgi:hypothetical protein
VYLIQALRLTLFSWVLLAAGQALATPMDAAPATQAECVLLGPAATCSVPATNSHTGPLAAFFAVVLATGGIARGRARIVSAAPAHPLA